MNIPEVHIRDAVEALEGLSDAAIRAGDTPTALRGYAMALRLRTELQEQSPDYRRGEQARRVFDATP